MTCLTNPAFILAHGNGTLNIMDIRVHSREHTEVWRGERRERVGKKAMVIVHRLDSGLGGARRSCHFVDPLFSSEFTSLSFTRALPGIFFATGPFKERRWMNVTLFSPPPAGRTGDFRGPSTRFLLRLVLWNPNPIKCPVICGFRRVRGGRASHALPRSPLPVSYERR